VRFGCDLHPIDPRTTQGRIALTAYVWPDQVERHERLRAALARAQDLHVEVREQGAADFLDDVRLQEGTTTVLWHSVMWQYLPEDERRRAEDRIAALGAAATPGAGFARLAFEPVRRTPGGAHEFLVVLTQWPGGEGRVLGSAPPHGVPVSWE
jgi:hypothetical protein